MISRKIKYCFTIFDLLFKFVIVLGKIVFSKVKLIKSELSVTDLNSIRQSKI